MWSVTLRLAGTPHLLLSEAERRAAARFRVPADAHRFGVARTALRRVLSGYLGLSPLDLHFAPGPFGKPALRGEAGGPALHFNVSHSGERLLLAFARSREVGVDVEQVQPHLAREEDGEFLWSAPELAVLRQTPPARRAATFFDLWTRKEAVLKASGRGLSVPPPEVCVAAPGEGFLGRVALDPPAPGPRVWEVRALSVGPGYRAALAFEHRPSHPPRLRLWAVAEDDLGALFPGGAPP